MINLYQLTLYFRYTAFKYHGVLSEDLGGRIITKEYLLEGPRLPTGDFSGDPSRLPLSKLTTILSFCKQA